MLQTKMLSDLLISSRDSLTNKQIDTLRNVAVKGNKFSITIEDVPYKDLAIDEFQRDIKAYQRGSPVAVSPDRRPQLICLDFLRNRKEYEGR